MTSREYIYGPNPMRVHYSAPGTARAVCNKAGAFRTTNQYVRVTCETCKRILARRIAPRG